MCGIAAIFDLGGQREMDRELLSRMNQTQFHRGPDEGGVHVEPGVGLAHRRLSIIDLASRLSDSELFCYGKVGFGHFLRNFSLNRTIIRLKIAQKMAQTGLSLATNA